MGGVDMTGIRIDSLPGLLSRRGVKFRPVGRIG